MTRANRMKIAMPKVDGTVSLNCECGRSHMIAFTKAGATELVSVFSSMPAKRPSRKAKK